MSTENTNTTTNTTKQNYDRSAALVKKPTEPSACDKIVVDTK